MKLVKFAAIIPAIVIGILSTSSTSTVKSESVVPAPVFNSRIETPTICPVVGDGNKANFDIGSVDPEVPVYQHCSSCSIGVYAEHNDGKMSCTYCGKSEQPPAGE